VCCLTIHWSHLSDPGDCEKSLVGSVEPVGALGVLAVDILVPACLSSGRQASLYTFKVRTSLALWNVNNLFSTGIEVGIISQLIRRVGSAFNH